MQRRKWLRGSFLLSQAGILRNKTGVAEERTRLGSSILSVPVPKFKSKGDSVLLCLPVRLKTAEHRLFRRAFLLSAVLTLLCVSLIACSSQNSATGGGPPGAPMTYSTNFPATENPISEGGKWINGGLVGLDWTNVRTNAGLAFGTESGSNGYDDSTAVLAGNWGPDQTAQATVHTINPNSNIFEEVELRLRTTIVAHSITGYEINFRCTSDGSQYVQIVRWNGPLGSFTYVSTTTGPGLHDGDVVKATITGSTITAYVNGTSVLQGTDGTYSSGSPGTGFFLGGAAVVNSDYGFTSFAASD